MHQHTARFVGLVAGTVFLASACSDTTQPTSPANPTASEAAKNEAASSGVQQPADPIAAARQVPGFGGFFFDASGAPTIYLKDPSARSKAETALRSFLDAEGISASALRVRQGDFDWASLERWQGQASTEVLAMKGTVFVDADEVSNRVTIGVERGTSPANVKAVIARLGIPAAAVVVEETAPIRQLVSLRNRVRPLPAGVQITFHDNLFVYACSLGFNATRNGQRSFITASHCSLVQGGTESTAYWQPNPSGAAAKIATEVADPQYSHPAGCPTGRRCRRSDAARAAYTSGTTSALGSIARTTGANNGSLTISGNFNITAEGSPIVGQTANKVGRTTGWSQGKIIRKCVDEFVDGSDIVQLCQSEVAANVGAGDSGAPVFRRQGTGSNVTLLGILWGGRQDGSRIIFAFSPISNIESELGALTTF